jgi:uncharacterized delta-60 repeat protein
LHSFSGTVSRVAFLIFSIAVLLGYGTAAVRGQSALDGFDPNANGIIRAVVVQPDGKILIGGDFTSLSPNGGAAVTRNFLARLNPDGTLDTAFNPNASGEVAAIAVQADGKILAGGSFTSIGGQTRNFLARLDATTGAADSFNPNPNSDVAAIAVQADGRILVGGDFNQGNGTPTIGGATRNDIARLDPTTGLADSFDPNAGSTVYAIVVQADGKVLAGGDFNSIGGQTRHHIARLDGTTGLADAFAPDPNGDVYAIAIQADGKILVGGGFSGGSVGGQPRNYLARLDATTGLADSFNPNPNGQVNAIAVQPDGQILAGGLFTGSNSIGGQPRGRLARLDPNTGLADSFDPEANGPVLAIAVEADDKVLAGGQFLSLSPDGGSSVTRNHIARLETDGRLDQTLNLSIATGLYAVVATAVQPDNKILIGGYFTNVLGVTRINMARLNTDGTLDTAFNPDADNTVYAIAVQADGKILVGGLFNHLSPNGGTAVGRNYIARLNSDGTLDTNFNPNASGSVIGISVQADAKILLCGGFTNIDGQTRNGIARLNSDGTLDTTFNPGASGVVYALAVQADGKILAGGTFSGTNSIGGATRNYIARLDATTGLADSFDPNANGPVYVLAVQANGKILAGGAFTGANSIGGQSRNRIARLDPTTGLADAFNPSANAIVYAIAVQADSETLAGGAFSTIGGQTRNKIARLDATTGLADSFDANANNDVDAVAVQADGKIFAGGGFTSIGGQTRNAFARLSDDTGALRNLAVTQTSINWAYGGSTPLFTWVTFEFSTDNVNFTLLGNGTATGSNWSLTDLNLPAEENIYIRARGYYPGGYENGSESVAESVRNAFIVLPPPLNIQLSANTNVLLSWATNFTGFTLETSTNLNTNVWSGVVPAPVVSGTNYVVTNAISGSARFYRLSQ